MDYAYIKCIIYNFIKKYETCKPLKENILQLRASDYIRLNNTNWNKNIDDYDTGKNIKLYYHLIDFLKQVKAQKK